MKEKIIVFCPVNGWDCPYWTKKGICRLGKNAIKICDDFGRFWNVNDEFWIKMEE